MPTPPHPSCRGLRPHGVRVVLAVVFSVRTESCPNAIIFSILSSGSAVASNPHNGVRGAGGGKIAAEEDDAPPLRKFGAFLPRVSVATRRSWETTDSLAGIIL